MTASTTDRAVEAASSSGPAAAGHGVRRLSALRRAVRLAAILSAFAGFWGGAVLLAWLVLPLVAWFAPRLSTRPRIACQRVVAWTFRVFHGYMRALGLLDARVVSDLPRFERGPVVFVANHTTLVDVTAILSRIPNVSCIAKPVYSSNPFVGRLLRLAGFLDAGRGVEERAGVVTAAVERLGEGGHVLVFPEGTRSPEGGMRRLQRGAFEIACRAKVPVVPLVLRCEPSALRKGQKVWDQPDGLAVLSIAALPPIDPAEFGHSSRRMRDAVDARYRTELGLTIAGPLQSSGAEGRAAPDTGSTEERE